MVWACGWCCVLHVLWVRAVWVAQGWQKLQCSGRVESSLPRVTPLVNASMPAVARLPAWRAARLSAPREEEDAQQEEASMSSGETVSSATVLYQI